MVSFRAGGRGGVEEERWATRRKTVTHHMFIDHPQFLALDRGIGLDHAHAHHAN